MSAFDWRHEATATTEAIVGARRALATCLTERGACADCVHDVTLAVEELLANLVEHGYGEGQPGPFELLTWFSAVEVTVEFRDRAPAFDHSDAPEPTWEDEGRIGGLGVHLARQLVDRLEYARIDEENRTTLVRRLAAE